MSRNRNLIATVILAVSTIAQLRLAAAEAPVRLITLDPGHFHASLVQKSMYPGVVDPQVHVYSPGGPDLEGHLKRIEGFNSRTENPTAWKEVVYTGPDFLSGPFRLAPVRDDRHYSQAVDDKKISPYEYDVSS